MDAVLFARKVAGQHFTFGKRALQQNDGVQQTNAVQQGKGGKDDELELMGNLVTAQSVGIVS